MGFTKIHTYVAEGYNVNKHAIKEHQLLPDRIYIRTYFTGVKRTVYLHPSLSSREVIEEF